ncbi:dTDP-4-dehydrorhamnose reductase [Salinicola sp. LHM]|uniref:dTDP-4-dehydrorhamnose reductase n=1 Tax=Salinicola TaxID=404432 RepID=UPI000DA20E48|nr:MULTISPECIES: dTDP-4-dehydrorhamnose reductase [Salinicola]MEC8916845.1 dTDP-4-dehydrorhamnose reductase [Pseudomonadota bacterium]WQH31660.1 dTDP-4-dehydrorhamnose reductase [Salinicola sp. LHM]
MNILILGGSGQVGFELQRALAPLGNCIAPGRRSLDLQDAAAVVRLLDELGPSLVVNAAAWTAVDAAEKSRDEAFRLNAALPAQLADYCASHSAKLVHYSSDYVYPGGGDTAWQETSETGPLSVYGKSKLAGDEAVLASGADALIFRTSWVYSARGHNFMKTMLRLAREREALRIVGDQIGAPTPARLIAEVTLLAVKQRGEGRLEPGLYHLAPRGETNWHGFAQAIFRHAEALGETLQVKPDQVVSIATANYPTPARRPLNSRLSLEKVEQALGITLPNWESQLQLTLAELLEAA